MPTRREIDSFILQEYERLISTLKCKLRLDDVEAVDLAHDAIMRIYDSLQRYDPAKGTLPMWFSGILRNVILQVREGRRRPYVLDGEIDRTARDGKPVGDAIASDIGGFVLRSIEALPPMYAETVRMRYVDGLELKVIAKRLRVPLGTVKARLSRSPEILKDVLRIQETTARIYLEELRRKKA